MRKLTATSVILVLALTAGACTKQVSCYRDGKRDNKPPIPFALITRAAPALGLVARVY